MTITTFNKETNQDKILKEKPRRQGQRLMNTGVESENTNNQILQMTD